MVASSYITENNFHVKMMEVCLQLAAQAFSTGEVPVGALIVNNGQILAKNFNRCEELGDPTAHAECLVMSDVGRSRHSWRLDNCTLYVTLEPCLMCAGAAIQGRLERIVYGAFDVKAGACQSLFRVTDDPRLNHQIHILSGVLHDPCREILTRFFRERRSTS